MQADYRRGVDIRNDHVDSGVFRQRHRVAQPNPAVLDESFKRQRDTSNGTMKHAEKNVAVDKQIVDPSQPPPGPVCRVTVIR